MTTKIRTKIRTRHQSQTRDSYSAQKVTQTTTTSTRYGRKYCTIPTYYMRILIIVVVVGLFTVALINHRRPKVQAGVAVAHQAVLGEQSKECSSEDLYNNPSILENASVATRAPLANPARQKTGTNGSVIGTINLAGSV